MTDNLQERPASLARRPKPAPDETIDPVNYSQPPTASVSPPVGRNPSTAQPASSAKRKRELTFPFSTRLSAEVQELLDTAVDSEGITVRDAVEQAIRSRWGSKN